MAGLENTTSRAGRFYLVATLIPIVAATLLCSRLDALESTPVRSLVLIPATGQRVMMRTLVYRPRGEGPFRLAIFSHGTSSNPERREEQDLSHFERLALWFARRGYVVAVPQRPGHGETGGDWLEDYGRCDNPDYQHAAQVIADSIAAVIDHLGSRPYVRRSGIVLVGHSAGAWGALAFASRNPRSLAAVVNFAGGLGGRSYDQPNANCAPDRLIESAASFGRAAKVPTLWIYSANDSYFGPALSARLVGAFRAQGGRAEYHLLPAARDDGHFLVFSDRQTAWLSILEAFVRDH